MHFGHAPWPCTTISQCPRHRLQILTPLFSWPSQEREWARASCFCPGKGRDAGCCARGKEGHAPWPCPLAVHYHQSMSASSTPDSDTSIQLAFRRKGNGRELAAFARGREETLAAVPEERKAMHLGHAPWPCTTISQCPRHRLQILTPLFSWPSQEREWARASCFCPGKGRDAGCCARGKEGHAPWPCPLAVHYHQSMSASSTPDSDTSIQLAFPGKGMGAS